MPGLRIPNRNISGYSTVIKNSKLTTTTKAWVYFENTGYLIEL